MMMAIMTTRPVRVPTLARSTDHFPLYFPDSEYVPDKRGLTILTLHLSPLYLPFIYFGNVVL